MYITSRRAKVLFRLGFPHKEPAPGDAYAVGEQEWIVGGEVTPSKQTIIPPQVIKNGIWLPSTIDLWIWLTLYTDVLIIRHNIDDSKCLLISAQIKNKMYEQQNSCSGLV